MYVYPLFYLSYEISSVGEVVKVNVYARELTIRYHELPEKEAQFRKIEESSSYLRGNFLFFYLKYNVINTNRLRIFSLLFHHVVFRSRKNKTN